MLALLGAAAVLTLAGRTASAHPPLGSVQGVSGPHVGDRDLLSKCDLKWFDAKLDHYSAVRAPAVLWVLREQGGEQHSASDAD